MKEHQSIIKGLVKRHGAKRRADIQRGVSACAEVWSGQNGAQDAFHDFCLEQYVPPGRGRNALLERLDGFHQAIGGAAAAGYKVARAGQDIADFPVTPAEQILAAYAPDSHLYEDYRRFRVTALIQLNFGTDERTPPRTRAGWAARRLGDVGREVVPAELLAKFSEAQAATDRFVSSYNLHLDRFDFGDARVKFPKGTRLISHWGLRDTMTSLHGSPHALLKQKAILGLMRRVVDGEIPSEVVDDPNVRWNIPAGRVTVGGKTRVAKGQGARRWEGFRRVWQIQRKIDRHRRFGNLIDNKFLLEREIPEDKVVRLLTDIVSSPLAERVAQLLERKLRRPMEPFDIYYRDFSPQPVGKAAPGVDVRKRYPSSQALGDAIADILVRLGWKRDRARWIQSKIRVDNGRSAGHAWPPCHDDDLQLLRVRVGKGGCDEINFETFMHELGHCVEGVLTSFEVDHKALWGVPNTAVTEGFAFTFQDRTQEILGRRRPRRGSGDKTLQDTVTLQRFWEPFEIAGSALTEIRFYHWLYEHPNATAKQMMEAVRRIGDTLWKQYYARIFGAESHGLLSVYSHMLWGDFYLAEYPLGYVMAYQIRKHLVGKPLAAEMERMCGVGRIYPEQWMQAAVGQGISVEPLLVDTEKALRRLGG